MRHEVTNRTDAIWHQQDINNNSQTASPVQPPPLFTAAHSNGSRNEAGLFNRDAPAQKTSGIVPGLLAAGLFIIFLLGLYAILWKCMVSQPNRRPKKPRSIMRKKPDALC